MKNNENQIALVASRKNYIYLLPGGGIDEGEEVEKGIMREVKEESGYDIVIESQLGRIDDYRNRDKKHNINYCAIAHVVGERGDVSMTESEIENGLHVEWKSINEVKELFERQIAMLKKGEIMYYNTAFNVNRDFYFIKEYMSLL